MSNRMARRRPAGALAFAAIAALALAACSNGGGSGESSTTTGGATNSSAAPSDSATPADSGAASPGVDDGTELSMWTRAPLEAQAKRLVEAYNASHQNQVKLEIVPNDDMEGKVGAAATNNQLPDLLAGDVVRLPYWVANGLFADLTDDIDALPYADDIARGHLDAGTDADGMKHTVPFVMDISVMVWNKDLYREAGLDPDKGPTTLAEFKQQAEAVAALKKDGVSGTFYGGNCGGCLVFTWFPTVWASGDEVISADGKTSLLASDSAKAVYQTYADLNNEGAVGAGAKEETGATWTAPFQQGKVGVMPYPNTAVAAVVDAGIDVGVGPIPGVDGGESTFVGGDAMGISKDSKHVDQAWNFLAWMLSDDTQLNVVAKGGDVPARVSLLDNQYTAADPLALAGAKTVEFGRTPVAPYFAEAFNAPGSPWITLFRNATFDQTNTVDADNDAITAILSQ
jgi:multiple sugar transport system substrate-binding protein